ncbi:RNA-binding S4 domain-containing protein [Pseudanabaena sp. FACHB-2040]|uniref:RNA-binding S4 domain-containing protein n=1 Tax=Pseudanabaena sp. FACHB-2040 TaxID=2692859 RepID=UPI0016882C53|nr:RNA-binding S4 domain-containing protein [Pseudanabaena sp. FACHB-2040]MBD2259073.1 RNA-binding S4 domain-containing protein [Pseudanabaena sp. FACHB-2040]
MNTPTEPFIKLDQFLKLMQIAPSGGQAKLLIQDGYIQVNGLVETRRGRKLFTGDKVTFEDIQLEVNLSDLTNLA